NIARVREHGIPGGMAGEAHKGHAWPLAVHKGVPGVLEQSCNDCQYGSLATGTWVGQKCPLCDGVPVVWRLPSPPAAAPSASHAVHTHHHHWSNHAGASGGAGPQKPSLAGHILRYGDNGPFS